MEKDNRNHRCRADGVAGHNRRSELPVRELRVKNYELRKMVLQAVNNELCIMHYELFQYHFGAAGHGAVGFADFKVILVIASI